MSMFKSKAMGGPSASPPPAPSGKAAEEAAESDPHKASGGVKTNKPKSGVALDLQTQPMQPGMPAIQENK